MKVEKSRLLLMLMSETHKQEKNVLNIMDIYVKFVTLILKIVYGDIGKGFIHVHHIVDISTIGENYKINPIEDSFASTTPGIIYVAPPPLGPSQIPTLPVTLA